jgi:hypothetical protein
MAIKRLRRIERGNTEEKVAKPGGAEQREHPEHGGKRPG